MQSTLLIRGVTTDCFIMRENGLGMKMLFRCFLAALCVGTVFGQVVFAQAEPAVKPAPVSLNELSSSLESLVNKIRPSVVQIFSTGYAAPEDSDTTSTAALLSKQHSTGSGIVVSADGYIVTNAHVVRGARRIQVRLRAMRPDASGRPVSFHPEGKLIEAKLVGTDREADIAVIKIDVAGLPHLQFGDSGRLHHGDLVMDFGNPLVLERSVSI